MICSSVNRLRFIVRLPLGDGLYSKLEEFSGAQVRHRFQHSNFTARSRSSRKHSRIFR